MTFVAAVISLCLLSNPGQCPLSRSARVETKACHAPAYKAQVDLGDGNGEQTYTVRVQCQ